MSRAQHGLSKNYTSLLDAGLPVSTKGGDHHCQASEPRMVDPSVPPHVPPQVHQPVDDFLTAIQTYHLELDVENLVGRLPACFVPGFARQKSLIRSYVKDLTLYDIHSGVLVLPWQGFGDSAFAFVFSDLILVDNSGKQYKCGVKFGVDVGGELACNVSGGWRDLCAFHGLVEGDRVKFSVAHFSASNVMYVSIYPRVRVEDYLNMGDLDD
ncbi:hypothetical protein P8452_02563 [Trifolium repens]|nr:hypothetical protein P8452_02563 [Trifolium repens]